MNEEPQIQTTVDIDIKVDNEVLQQFLLTQVNIVLKENDIKPVDSLDHLKDYKMYVPVPGGGDWSNMNLTVLCNTLSNDAPLCIRAKVKF